MAVNLQELLPRCLLLLRKSSTSFAERKATLSKMTAIGLKLHRSRDLAERVSFVLWSIDALEYLNGCPMELSTADRDSQ
jgi:hypothetical protein